MRHVKFILLHIVIVILLFAGFRSIQHKPPIPDEVSLHRLWDAEHYYTIKTEGYSYNPSRQSNVAFFPGFPYLWKYSGLDAYGIIILNLFLVIAGILILSSTYTFTSREILVYLALPGLIYFYVPYSEPLFFLEGALLIVGLKNDNLWLIAAGIFLCGITRSAANVFVPAIILTEYLVNNSSWKRAIIYSIVALASVAFVSFIQHYQTGSWFGFYQTQKYWSHKLQLPSFPFSTWGHVRALDFPVAAVGLAFLFYCIYLIFNRIQQNHRFEDRSFIFSILIIAGLTSIALLYKGGTWFSINRYLLPTPFFMVAGILLLRKISVLKIDWWKIFAGIWVVFCIFHAFQKLSLVLSMTLIAIILSLLPFIYSPNKRVASICWIVVYVSGLLTQIFLLDYFMSRNQFGELNWVG